MSNATPLDEYFADYPYFAYDASAPIVQQFRELCRLSHWSKAQKSSARADFKDALTRQFNHIYGTDVNDIESWNHLCQVINITPLPSGLKACRNAVKQTHVNLVDLIDTIRTGEDVKIFGTAIELSEYTISTGKYFPQQTAIAGGVLRYLLRYIHRPEKNKYK